MQDFFHVFSNREIAALIWTGLFIAALFFSRKIREPIFRMIKSFFGWKILKPFSLLTAYVLLTIYLLYKLTLWDIALLKDSIFWFFGVAVVLFFDSNKAKDIDYFKRKIKQCFKWTIGIEFLVNLYSFSLVAELFIIPVMTTLSLIQVAASMDKKDEQVNKYLSNFLSIIGITLFGVIIYKTIVHYDLLLTFDNLKGILLPVMLTIFIFPFIYLLAMYFVFEEISWRIDFKNVYSNHKKKLKQQIFWATRLNLNRLNKLSSKIYQLGNYKPEELQILLKRYSRLKKSRS